MNTENKIDLENFANKVRAMSAKELIMAMVNGLEKEWVAVSMNTYGMLASDGICYGCAATNAICEIIGAPTTPDEPNWGNRFYKERKSTFMCELEMAYNWLRTGFINDANYYFKKLGCATIDNPNNIRLAQLESDTYKDNLECYRQLANSQPNS
jgi:hypothetical protein